MAQKSIADLFYDAPTTTLQGTEVLPVDAPTQANPTNSTQYQSNGLILNTLLSWILGKIPAASSTVSGLMNSTQFNAVAALKTVATTGAYSDLTGLPSLSTVATSGAYADLTGRPTLGSAAAASTTEFATAAQGALASTALQPNASGQLALTANRGLINNLGTVSTTTQAIDLSAGKFYSMVMGANITLSFTNLPPVGYMAELVLYIAQDATGSRVATWPAGGRWVGGTPMVVTTAANSVDMVKFFIDSAGNWVAEALHGVA